MVTAQSSCGLCFFSRARYISVSSTDVTCLVRINSASCVTCQNAASSRFFGRSTVRRRAHPDRTLRAIDFRAGNNGIEVQRRRDCIFELDFPQLSIVREIFVYASEHVVELRVGELEAGDGGGIAQHFFRDGDGGSCGGLLAVGACRGDSGGSGPCFELGPQDAGKKRRGKAEGREVSEERTAIVVIFHKSLPCVRRAIGRRASLPWLGAIITVGGKNRRRSFRR